LKDQDKGVSILDFKEERMKHKIRMMEKKKKKKKDHTLRQESYDIVKEEILGKISKKDGSRRVSVKKKVDLIRGMTARKPLRRNQSI